MDIEAIALMGGKIVTGAGVVAGIVKGAQKAYKTMKGVESIIEETKKNNEEQPKIVKAVEDLTVVVKHLSEQQAHTNIERRKMADDIAEIRREVLYNGGSSNKDMIRSILNHQNANWELSPQPQFKCNAHGNIVGANLAMLEIIGIGIDEAKGDGLFLKASNPDGLKKAIVNTIENGANLMHSEVTFNGVKGVITARIIRDSTGKAMDLYAVFNKAA